MQRRERPNPAGHELFDASTRVRRESERLRAVSDQIIAAVDALRDLELRARKVPVGSAEFERLSNEIAAASRDVFRMAGEQSVLASEYEPADATIDDADEGA